MKNWIKALFCALAMALPNTTFADGLEDMSAAERAAFRAEVRAYLLDNPEVLLEAIQVLEDSRQNAAEQTDLDLVVNNYDALVDDGFSYVGGNVDGDITVVEFLDYRCGYCKKAHDEVAAFLKNNPDVRYVIKEFPILGEDSTESSRAAVSVLTQQPAETYMKFHNALMKFNGPINDKTLASLLEDAGGDVEAMFAHMNDELVDQIIAKNHQLASAMQITGTPTFIIGPQMVRGYVPLATMEAILADAREALVQ